MSRLARLDAVYEKAPRIILNKNSKYVFMSDVHRGVGNQGDNFVRNRTVYQAALMHYYREGYTYAELGDGDELWENKRMDDIASAHSDIFSLLRFFCREGRLVMLFGNHDIEKGRRPEILASYEPEKGEKPLPLLPNLTAQEGVVLRWKDTPYEILLVHGHQADFFNDALWPVARFLVRYFWRPLELLGVKDPTSAARNRKLKDKVEDTLKQWVLKRGVAIIAGHTHRTAMPSPGETPYFNDGCCVRLLGLTALEISGGRVTLVQWLKKARPDGVLHVARERLAGPFRIERFFKAGSPAESA